MTCLVVYRTRARGPVAGDCALRFCMQILEEAFSKTVTGLEGPARCCQDVASSGWRRTAAPGDDRRAARQGDRRPRALRHPGHDIVKGTPLAKMRRRRRRQHPRPAASADHGSAGRRRPGAQHQRLLVVRGRSRPRAPDRRGAERGARASGWRRIPIASSRWRRWRCSIPIWPPSSSRTASKRLGLRGASIGGHVNGEDLSLPKYDPFWAKAAELGVLVFMHPGGADNIVKDGALRGPRRSRQHHRQSARDDLLPVAADLRRDARQVSRPARLRARMPAATCRRISDGPKPRAWSAATPTAPTRRSRASI